MASLFARMIQLFPDSVRLEDLFTEAVARLFERRPELCLAWLEETDLISRGVEGEQRYVRVNTQESFVRLEDHEVGSRPDMVLKVYHSRENDEAEDLVECVLFESKVGSSEGRDQLKRYAIHLDVMRGDRKTLVYITRAYDPKDPEEILEASRGVEFRQMRWHDFYKFLKTVEKDTLVEEVMLFMEEQGMARSHRFTTADLIALTGVPRAFEIFDETFGDEVRAELEEFAGNKVKGGGAFGPGQQIRAFRRYIMLAQLEGWYGYCFLSHEMDDSDGFSRVKVYLEVPPKRSGQEAERDVFVEAMKQVALWDGWDSYDLEDAKYGKVSCERSLASFLSEEDHVAAIKRFFIESIQQLREEFTAFKKEHPDLPWSGE